MHEITLERFELNLEIPSNSTETKTYLITFLDLAWQRPEKYVVSILSRQSFANISIPCQACRISKPIYRGSRERQESSFCCVRLSLAYSCGSHILTQPTDLQVYLIITIAYEQILATSKQRPTVEVMSSRISWINVSIGNLRHPPNPTDRCLSALRSGYRSPPSSAQTLNTLFAAAWST